MTVSSLVNNFSASALSEYVVGDKLQSSVFGCVRLAIRENGQRVVLKISDKRKMNYRSGAEDPVAEQQLFQYLDSLPHGEGRQHLLRAVGHHEDANSHVLALEYCTNGDLFDAINQGLGALSDAETSARKRELFRQMCSGVQYLHRHNIVHRDISPENVFLSGDVNNGGEMSKLGDLGQARVLSPGEVCFNAGDRAGKKGYRAPELIAGLKHDPKAADVFSLGVCLFILLTGLPPFVQASKKDKCWRFCSRRQLGKLVNAWHLQNNVDPQALDLLNGILCEESTRLTLDQVQAHSFLAQDLK